MKFLGKRAIVKLMVQVFVVIGVFGITNCIIYESSINCIIANAAQIPDENGNFQDFTAVDVECGNVSTYFLDYDGNVWQSGVNHATLPTKINISDVKSISAGKDGHVFFMKIDGTIWAYGTNGSGQLGISNTTNVANTPVKVDISNVSKITCGNWTTFFLKDDGTVYACGANNYGQLGIGNTTNQSSIVKVPINDVKYISAYNHTLFTKNDGTVYSCGDNYWDQLGFGGTPCNTPTKINISGVKKAFANWDTSIFVMNNNATYGCGLNGISRELGLGSNLKTQTTPIKLNIMDVSDVKFSECGIFYVKTDNTVYLSGHTYGTSAYNNSTGFIKLPITDLKALAVGQDHSVYIKNNGTVWAAGNNQNGQLGVGGSLNVSRDCYVKVGTKQNLTVTSELKSTSGVTITFTATPPTGINIDKYSLPDGEYISDSKGGSLTFDVSNDYKAIESTNRIGTDNSKKIILKNITKNGDYTMTFKDQDGNTVSRTVTVSNY